MFPFHFALSPSYGVTADGQVVRLNTGHVLKPSLCGNGGYLAVSLWENGKGKKWFVHQIVALVFHGPRPSPKHDAAHRDGNKLNNRYTNLRWATRAENEHDKIAHGRSNRGERNGGAKLTSKQIEQIRIQASALPRSSGGKRIKKGALIPLAAEYGVTRSCLRQIILGQRWIS